MNACAPYFKIESFGASDGPGVRLVIFLQGCPWRCLYCHNPESWAMTSNKFISVDVVINKFNKQQSFYRNGGITISGGEPLIHKNFCLELAKRCHQNKIHLTIDTSGATFVKSNIVFFKKIIKYHPLWIIDIKQINKNKHEAITGCKTQNEINLIKFLEFNKQKYWIRQVFVPGYTDNKNDLMLLRNFIRKLKWMSRFDFLPYHKLALHKYENLKLPYQLKNTKKPTIQMIRIAKRIVFGK